MAPCMWCANVPTLVLNSQSTSTTPISSIASSPWIRPKRNARCAKRVKICTANIAAWAS